MQAATFDNIRAAIKAAGGNERLTRLGEGIFRFVDGDTKEWAVTTVHVPNLLALTVPQWVERWATMRANRKTPAQAV